jgi:FKBP-type peptidyl-prolyl cis-trans isomerase FkpA
MKHLSFILFFAVLLVASCKDDTTPNGYKYILHKKGEGPKAKPGEYAYVHVDIMVDDTLVNSTREMERPLAVNVIDLSTITKDETGKAQSNPIQDIVGMLAVGDSASVFVPIDESMRSAPQLQNAKQLVYNIVMLDIKNEEQYQQAVTEERKEIDAQIEALKAREADVSKVVASTVKDYKSGALASKLQSLETGLKYLILEQGTGDKAQNGKPVQVHYYGVLTNGQMFDNSFQAGRPLNFTLGAGEVIPGWDQGLAQLKVGDKAILFIPSDLAYGPNGTGSIPPNSELIFYVELVKAGK